MKQTRLTALLLSLCMIFPMAACTGNTPETEAEETKDSAEISTDLPESGTETQTDTETEPETEPYVNLYEDLGEADFNDYEFRILFGNGWNSVEGREKFVLIEDYVGEPIDDAIFEANAKVMDLANIKLSPVFHEDPVAAISTVNSSGDTYFDLASAYPTFLATAGLSGALLNLNNLPHINWEAAWWPQFTMDSLRFHNTIMMFSNYSSYESCYSTKAIFANMDLIDKYGMEHPHDLLSQNRWTMDQLISMTKNADDDVNGDGIMDRETDVWGFVEVGYIWGYFEGWNIEIYDKTDDGAGLYLNVGENIANIMEKMYYWFNESPGVSFTSKEIPSTSQTGPFLADLFKNKNIIYIYNDIGPSVKTLMKTDISYAILPLPKLDETVPEYYSGSMDWPFSVPKIYPKDRYDMLGYVIEAMAISGYEKIYPAYVETALKYRYSPSQDDSKVIDMIFQNRIMGFSYLYHNYFFPLMMDELFEKETFTYSSYIASGMKKNEAWVKKLQNALLDLGEN